MQKEKVIFLMGPTAAGKSDLAIALSEKISVEIISVDSAMVYQGMDIGTGKPSPAELASVPHHLISIRDPRDTYSAAEFAQDALALIDQIVQRGRTPVLVGGTLLYFKALQQGLSPLPSADPLVRAHLWSRGQQEGWAKMHEALREIDPVSAARIHPNDIQRIQRALEVYELTQKPMSSFFRENTLSPLLEARYDLRAFILSPEHRADLHQRIEARFYRMLEKGLVEEVACLFKRGDLSPALPSIRAVGYRQVWQYLEGQHDYQAMCDHAIAATRQLAKRQLTWLRALPSAVWLANDHLASLNTVIHCGF